MKAVVFAGSLREDSVNKKLAKEAVDFLNLQNVDVSLIDITEHPIPLYNADFEASSGMPEQAKVIKEKMIASDAIVIVSPEYNASLPGVLKNIIDWASRSEEGKPTREPFENKKFAIMSASPGPLGGSRALVHLRQILVNLKANVMEKELSIPGAYEKFDEQGKLTDSELKKQIGQVLQQLFSSN